MKASRQAKELSRAWVGCGWVEDENSAWNGRLVWEEWPIAVAKQGRAGPKGRPCQTGEEPELVLLLDKWPFQRTDGPG